MGDLRALLCSRNRHKLDELRRALPGWELDLLGAGGYPPEDGASYYENALGKARFGRTAAAGAAWTVGEDSGIEVAALGGAPGIRSARYGGSDPVSRLLADLEGMANRGARYVCELVALGPSGEELRGTGTLAGRIAIEPHGSEGFGYDPVFIPEGETATVAELGDAWKAKRSHRARAAVALADSAAAAGVAPHPAARTTS